MPARHDAETYIHGHHESVLRSHRWRTAANSAAYLLDRLRPGMSILDIGCGPGTITVDLARIVAPGRVVGLDREQTVLDTARTAAVDASADAVVDAGIDVTFETGDVYDLGYEDDAFDVVHAHQVLQHLSDPVSALVEMRRVCRPDGLVAARDSDYAAMTWYPEDPVLDEWLALYREVAHAAGGEPDAGRRILAWAHEAGFTDVEASASVWCFADADDREWWGGLWADRVIDSAFAKQAVDGAYASATELDDIAAAWRHWADADDGWFAVVHGEILCHP